MNITKTPQHSSSTAPWRQAGASSILGSWSCCACVSACWPLSISGCWGAAWLPLSLLLTSTVTHSSTLLLAFLIRRPQSTSLCAFRGWKCDLSMIDDFIACTGIGNVICTISCSEQGSLNYQTARKCLALRRAAGLRFHFQACKLPQWPRLLGFFRHAVHALSLL